MVSLTAAILALDPRRFIRRRVQPSLGAEAAELLLCHDPRLKYQTAKIAVGINAGSFQDSLAGTAHLFEHVAFLGSERFAGRTTATGGVETSFDLFLASIGGSTNAATYPTHTIFTAVVPAAETASTLDRLLDMVRSPTIDPRGAVSEISAVDAEHQKNLADPGHVVFNTAMMLMDKPLSGFTTGSRETLGVGLTNPHTSNPTNPHPPTAEQRTAAQRGEEEEGGGRPNRSPATRDDHRATPTEGGMRLLDSARGMPGAGEFPPAPGGTREEEQREREREREEETQKEIEENIEAATKSPAYLALRDYYRDYVDGCHLMVLVASDQPLGDMEAQVVPVIKEALQDCKAPQSPRPMSADDWWNNTEATPLARDRVALIPLNARSPRVVSVIEMVPYLADRSEHPQVAVALMEILTTKLQKVIQANLLALADEIDESRKPDEDDGGGEDGDPSDEADDEWESDSPQNNAGESGGGTGPSRMRPASRRRWGGAAADSLQDAVVIRSYLQSVDCKPNSTDLPPIKTFIAECRFVNTLPPPEALVTLYQRYTSEATKQIFSHLRQKAAKGDLELYLNWTFEQDQIRRMIEPPDRLSTTSALIAFTKDFMSHSNTVLKPQADLVHYIEGFAGNQVSGSEEFTSVMKKLEQSPHLSVITGHPRTLDYMANGQYDQRLNAPYHKYFFEARHTAGTVPPKLNLDEMSALTPPTCGPLFTDEHARQPKDTKHISFVKLNKRPVTIGRIDLIVEDVSFAAPSDREMKGIDAKPSADPGTTHGPRSLGHIHRQAGKKAYLLSLLLNGALSSLMDEAERCSHSFEITGNSMRGQISVKWHGYRSDDRWNSHFKDALNDALQKLSRSPVDQDGTWAGEGGDSNSGEDPEALSFLQFHASADAWQKHYVPKLKQLITSDLTSDGPQEGFKMLLGHIQSLVMPEKLGFHEKLAILNSLDKPTTGVPEQWRLRVTGAKGLVEGGDTALTKLIPTETPAMKPLTYRLPEESWEIDLSGSVSRSSAAFSESFARADFGAEDDESTCSTEHPRNFGAASEAAFLSPPMAIQCAAQFLAATPTNTLFLQFVAVKHQDLTTDRFVKLHDPLESLFANRLAVQCMTQKLNLELFDVLRNQERIGYIVDASPWEGDAVASGLFIRIQSPSWTAGQIMKRVEAITNDFAESAEPTCSHEELTQALATVLDHTADPNHTFEDAYSLNRLGFDAREHRKKIETLVAYNRIPTIAYQNVLNQLKSSPKVTTFAAL